MIGVPFYGNRKMREPLFQLMKPQPVYDVAIIGSGAAGGMTAHALIAQGFNVLMLEAGPLRSLREFPIHRVRRWNFPCRAVRGGLGQQKPNCAEVELAKAAEALPGRGLKELPIPKAILPVDHHGRPCCHHCGPCWQGCDSGSKFDSLRVFVQTAQRTGKLTLLVGARVRSLALNRDNRIQSAHYWDVKDRTYREVRARTFVLAAGCIESTQILLNSEVANSSGLVGHYLSEHLYGAVGGYLPQLMGRPTSNEDSNGSNVFIPDLARNWRGSEFIRGYQIYPAGGIPDTTFVGLNIPGFGQAWKKKSRE